MTRLHFRTRTNLWNSYRVQLLPDGEAQTRAVGDLRGLLQLHGRAAFTSASPSTQTQTSPHAPHCSATAQCTMHMVILGNTIKHFTWDYNTFIIDIPCSLLHVLPPSTLTHSAFEQLGSK